MADTDIQTVDTDKGDEDYDYEELKALGEYYPYDYDAGFNKKLLRPFTLNVYGPIEIYHYKSKIKRKPKRRGSEELIHVDMTVVFFEDTCKPSQKMDAKELYRYVTKFETEKNIVKARDGLDEMIELLEGQLFNDPFLPQTDEDEDDDQEAVYGTPTIDLYCKLCDINPEKRSVVDLNWDPEDIEVLAAAYNDYQRFAWEQKDGRFGCVWNIYRRTPLLQLDADSPITILRYNEVQSNEIACGLMTGQIYLFDVREGPKPVWMTKKLYTFYDVVTCLQWTNENTGKEITAGSLDGQIKWFDIRYGQKSLDCLIMDMTEGDDKSILSRAVGISSFCYDEFMPSRFLAGTTNGYVVYGYKKEKLSRDKIGMHIFKCHEGPVNAIVRNYSNIKYFLTAGEWLLKVWYDDYERDTLFWGNYGGSFITSAQWSRVRTTVVLIAYQDGTLELWDFLKSGINPIVKTNINEIPIRRAVLNDHGEYIASGDDNGTITIQNCSRHFGVFNEVHMAETTKWLDRELAREKSLELKLRELKLKAKQAGKPVEKKDDTAERKVHQENIKKAHDFFGFTVDKVVETRKEVVDKFRVRLMD